MKQELSIVACPPAEDVEALNALGISNFKPVPNSEIVQCEKCSRKIWIGPGQMRIVKDPTVQKIVLCYFCGLLLAKKGEWDVSACSKTGHSFDFKL